MEFKYDGKSRKSGVYKITNLTNGKVYIGSTQEFKRRSTQHLRSLEKGVHQNKHLQHAFNKDGTENFIFEVLEVVLGDKLARTTVEQTYLDQYLDDWERCYNFKKKTASKERSCYSKTPEESRQRQSVVSKKMWEDPKYRALHKEAMAQTDTSRYTKEAMKNPKIREKISKGVRASITPETRKVRSDRMKKLWKDPEYRRYMCEKKLGNKNRVGKQHTEETKKKIAATLKRKIRA